MFNLDAARTTTKNNPFNCPSSMARAVFSISFHHPQYRPAYLLEFIPAVR